MAYKFINGKGEHLHELDGKPLMGTSTVLKVLSKPFTWWAAELAAVSALESGEHIPTIRQEYEEACNAPNKKKAIDELQRKYPAFKAARFAHYERMNESADKGTGMHEELEKYVKLMISDQDGKPMLLNSYEHPAVKIFAEWAVKNVKKFLVSEGYCYSRETWTGGVTDCIAELENGQVGILDFKSSKEAYISQFIQCAGYDTAVSENGVFDKDGNELMKLEKSISFYAVIPFGAKAPEPEFNYDVDSLKKGFAACTVIYKLTNKI